MNIGRVLATGTVSLLLVAASHVRPFAAPHYGGWSAPVHLPSPINSESVEQSATPSNDDLSLFFTSTRPCGAGDLVADANIWVARRDSLDSPWGEPECLEINMDGFEESNPGFSRDGHWMFFVSNRPGSLGAAGTPAGRDIWFSWRAHVHDDHDWGEPVNAGPVLNSTVADAGPTYVENDGGLPQLIFTSQRAGVFDLFVSDLLGNGEFSAPRPIAELNTPDLVEAGPTIRHDGLEMFFFRGATAPFDIFTATRSDPSGPWEAPVLVPISSAFNEQAPRLSKDGRTIFFASNRGGPAGGLDIWMATREKVPGRP